MPRDTEFHPPPELPPDDAAPGEVTAQPGSGEALLNAALAWAARGFKVFPLIREGKTPAREGWQAMASSDPEAIRQMWTEMTALDADGRPAPRIMAWNVGYLTDDLVVIDIDTKKDPDACQIYADELLGDFDTLEVRTTSGGTHLIYANPARDRSSKVNLENLPIDIKAVGGLAVAPGSVFNGNVYAIAADRPVKLVPPHIARRIPLARERHQKTGVVLADLDKPAAVKRAIKVASKHPAADKGGRGIACYRLAALLRDYAISVDMAKEIIAEHWSPRCDPPFPFADTRDEDGPVQGADATIEHAFAHAQNDAGAKSAEATLGGVVLRSAPTYSEPLTPASVATQPDRLTAASSIGVVAELTEDGAATSFLRRYIGTYRRDWDTGRDHWWDGSSWHHDKKNFAFTAMREVLRDLTMTQAATPGEAARMGKAATAAGALKFVQADRAVAVTQDVWDTDLHLLGTPAGTVDLSKNELLPAHPGHNITRLTAVAPDDQPTPIWDAFLRDVTGGDRELIGFLQRAAGYTLTGLTTEHALFFLHGPGGNGKSVFVNALLGIMGAYGQAATMDAFTQTAGEKHLTFLATLAGARMVVATETEQGRAWAEARVKQMTGGDQITANFMRRDPFSFWPRFKVWITGNHAPNLRNVDDAMRRRINIIPFAFTPPVPDKHLEEKLYGERKGILAWMIRGCAMWQRDGLQRPPVVLRATADYFSAQDVFGLWAAERLIRDSDASVQPSALLDSFNEWARRQGETTVSAKVLKAAWTDRQKGLRYVARNGQNFIKGVKIKPPGFQDVAGPNLPPPPPPAKEAE